MSVIAWDGRTLVGDRQSTCGEGKSSVTKIFKVPQGLIGICGITASMPKLVAWFNGLCMPELYPEFQTDDDYRCEIVLITPDRKIWHFENEPDPFQIEQPYYAIGSGKDMAMAAMLAGADALKAVQITCYLHTHCGMGTNSLTLET